MNHRSAILNIDLSVMITLLEKPIPFGGGLSLQPNKAMSLSGPPVVMPVPRRLTVPLLQHIGMLSVPVVEPGDKVYKGQLIAETKANISACVHAPGSGIIINIEDAVLPTPSASTASCIIIETDDEDSWCEERQGIDDYAHTNPLEIQQAIRAAGIVGLGGAGFPSSVKLTPGLTLDIELLIINAAECEPYISCDETVIRHHVDELVTGIDILAHALRVDECVIAIEENKEEAITCLQDALARHNDKAIELKRVSSLYPAGGEKQLIKSLTGIAVSGDGLPVDVGIVTYNVNTALAVKRAVIDAEPLIRRMVTVTGPGIKQPQNVEVRIGTAIKDIIEFCGGYHDEADYLIVGGPMMGYRLADDNAPLIKKTNCLLALRRETRHEKASESPCIRCDECALVCPVALQPQQLHWHTKTFDANRLQDFRLFDCIECGCCSYVCPSHIPLVEQYRFAKKRIWNERRNKLTAQEHKLRYQHKQNRQFQRAARSERAASEKLKRNAEHGTQQHKQQVIAAAVERVKQKRLQQSRRNNN